MYAAVLSSDHQVAINLSSVHVIYVCNHVSSYTIVVTYTALEAVSSYYTFNFWNTVYNELGDSANNVTTKFIEINDYRVPHYSEDQNHCIESKSLLVQQEYHIYCNPLVCHSVF